MAQKTVKTNGTGRPKSYSPELVHEIIARSLEAGIPLTEIDADLVKEQLCKKHGVSDTIRQESLAKLVDAMHAEFIEKERKTLLAGLSGSIVASVEEAVAIAGRELLLIVARQNAACMIAADTECEELRKDKRNANWRIAELEAALMAQEDANRELEQVREAAATQIADISKNLKSAQAELEQVRRDDGPVERLLTELRNPAVREDIRAALAEITGTNGSELGVS
ncbi:hypothetical protein SAMN04488004_103242 [Loktanella salsilacus]|uniref:Replication region DNA-binding N-term n=1 Tax=Loktanella salsilacus TaxID=195913 RepID=A0A1I4D8I3_9RHOB|nr:hypothetical protein [Loktanella salsilacus]SFK88697.1 hypothetical protein SAMN04488004_103242 [Loktanella salsilacus]